MSPSVKIFISYKEKHRVLHNEIITPIQTGRALARQSFEQMLGDDTGDNISEKNNRYCEMSAQYWVWKQYQEIGNPDYVGFMHYRRFFVFDSAFPLEGRTPWVPGIAMYRVPCFDDMCLENIAPKHILETLSSAQDCYVGKPFDVRNFAPLNNCMKSHFLNYVPGSKREVWDAFCQIIEELYPQYVPYLEQFSSGSVMYACNMFIMRKELFFEYSSFCFGVLEALDKRIDSTAFKGQELRFLGFVAEYLLTIFVFRLQDQKAKLSFLDALFIEEPDLSVNMTLWKKKLPQICCVTNSPTHKILTLFGRQMKLCRRSKATILKNRINEQEKLLAILTNKVVNLEEEIAQLYKKNKR